MRIILVGSGAVASELTSYFEDENKRAGQQLFDVAGYLDSEENIEKYWSKYKFKKPVLSDVFSYTPNSGDNFIIAIADNTFKKKIFETLK